MGWQYQYFPFLFAGVTIINQNGLFVYNGTPALNNIIGAIAGQSTTDPLGNAVPAGITSWSYNAGSDTYRVTMNDQTVTSVLGNGIAIGFQDLSFNWSKKPFIAAQGGGTGSAAPFAPGSILHLRSGGTLSTDAFADLQLWDQSESGTYAMPVTWNGNAFGITTGQGNLVNRTTNGLLFGVFDTTNMFPGARDANANALDLGENIVVLSSSVNINSTTRTNVGNLSDTTKGYNMVAGSAYEFEMYLQTTAVSGGPATCQIFFFWIQGGGTAPTYVNLGAEYWTTQANVAPTALRSTGTASALVSGTPFQINITTTAGTQNWLELKGVVKPAVAGILGMNASCSVGTFTFQVFAGSWIKVRPIVAGAH